MGGSALLGSSHVWDSERNEFVNASHQRVAEVLAEYNPYLRLAYIPPADRIEADTHTYAVFYCRPDREPAMISMWREDEVDERILAHTWLNDSSKNDPLAYLEKLEAAREALILRERLEREAERRDKAEFAIKTPLHTINMGKGRVIRT